MHVEDYKLFCLARIEIRDQKITLIGILGSWWVIQSSPAQGEYLFNSAWSALVTTAKVLLLDLSTLRDILIDTQVGKSSVTDKTLRIMLSFGFGVLYFIIISEVCS
ncbi:hypothetical protein NE237_005912 [Protea cynaroides]|uniref:Uncharacterized protein n=1 Tax=Protea cynaroides TaxID=273540 RepID=A0A9Q0KLA0_9MAGN|nr:hypothetical protein NE237_005912 [Protea cynaroides]